MSNANAPGTPSTTSTATTTPSTPAFNPVNALITSLQTLITTAQAEAAASTAASADSQTSLQALVAHAQATILALQLQVTSQPTRTYTVKPTNLGAEPIFLIAQQQLGDWRRYSDIQTLNGLGFIALQVGQTLLLPAS